MAKGKSFVGRPRKISPGVAKYSQLAIYNRIAAKEHQIVDVIFKLMDSQSEKTRLDAASVLLDKVLPNKKAVELGNDKGGLSISLFGGGFVPPTAPRIASMGSTTRPTPIQSFSLAQESQENVNSSNRNRPSSAN
jgi:hypothetical protein